MDNLGVISVKIKKVSNSISTKFKDFMNIDAANPVNIPRIM